MSTKKNSGWKKIKTLKPGKAITISRFKGKSFKYYKNYYYKIVPNKGQYYRNGFCFYKYSTFRQLLKNYSLPVSYKLTGRVFC